MDCRFCEKKSIFDRKFGRWFKIFVSKIHFTHLTMKTSWSKKKDGRGEMSVSTSYSNRTCEQRDSCNRLLWRRWRRHLPWPRLNAGDACAKMYAKRQSIARPIQTSICQMEYFLFSFLFNFWYFFQIQTCVKWNGQRRTTNMDSPSHSISLFDLGKIILKRWAK